MSKIKLKEVEEKFAEFLTAKKLSPEKYLLKTSDARIGKFVGIFRKENNMGSISRIAGFYTYGEMLAYLDGIKESKNYKQ